MFWKERKRKAIDFEFAIAAKPPRSIFRHIWHASAYLHGRTGIQPINRRSMSRRPIIFEKPTCNCIKGVAQQSRLVDVVSPGASSWTDVSSLRAAVSKPCNSPTSHSYACCYHIIDMSRRLNVLSCIVGAASSGAAFSHRSQFKMQVKARDNKDNCIQA